MTTRTGSGAVPAGAPAETPLRRTLSAPRVPEPLTLVIFGGTGDLARRKLIPAVFRLWQQGLLPPGFAVVGVAREAITDEVYRERMREALAEFATAPAPGEWDEFGRRLFFGSHVFDDAEGFQRLGTQLQGIEGELGIRGNRLFYLAVPPGVVENVVGDLGRAGLVCPADCPCWTRIVVEKPFGRDLESARALNAALLRVYDERQLFRIDHYLGKETLQNLMVFRFGNAVWEPLWNRSHVDHVQITVSEEVGVEQRADYYETSGALRDMVQSHLLQILTLVAMEPPASYDADSIRNEKVKVLRAVRPVRGEDVGHETVRGQYTAGAAGTEPLRGYTDEDGVAPGSRTETFAALRLWVDDWRWAGVPFYLRTGKRLPAKATEVVVRFRPAPHPVMDLVENDPPAPNALVLRIQPREGISLLFEAKVPGLRGRLKPVSMDFDYRTAFPRAESPEAYQRLLLDAMLGDATLFARRDEVEAAWTLVTPILEEWERAGAPEPYPAGSWGPEGADRLLRADGREWWRP
ncbi:MAG TPA: glucose-6-phosphate dehydrogenase [Longimicrobiaceae bacterium]|nr:glucose-6-phosphate dehydrogenase [Longimicrobiaceae bacterium]